MNIGNTGTMLIAGQGGGKSTFIGAFVTHVRDINPNRWQGQYSLIYGNKSEFDEHIYNRMQSKKLYPEQTKRADPYVVRVKTQTDSGATAERSLTMMDIPGEIQEDRLDSAIEKLRTGNWHEDRIREAYDESGIANKEPIRKQLKGDNPQLNDEEEEILYLHQYKASNRVVFLLNLHKFINRPDLEPALSAELLNRVSREKRCLLLVTGADVINYDASTFRSGLPGWLAQTISPSNRLFDRSLRNKLITNNQTLPPNQRTSDIKALVRKAEDSDMSMFSVAVPKKKGENAIAVKNGQIRTPGFNHVAEWLTNR